MALIKLTDCWVPGNEYDFVVNTDYIISIEPRYSHEQEYSVIILIGPGKRGTCEFEVKKTVWELYDMIMERESK